MQVAGEVHQTPLRMLATPAGSGVLWTVQVLPFHCSARVEVKPVAAEPANPVAVHAVDETHETAFSVFWFVAVGLGAVWIVQALPFQRSASGRSASPTVGLEKPTAVQLAAEVHETPFSRLTESLSGLAPFGFGAF